MRYNNNPKNRRSYLDFYRRQLELSRETEGRARKLKINANIDRWETMLPDSLSKAKPNQLPRSLIKKIKGANLKPPYDKHIIITSRSSVSSTFTSHAIIHGLIQMGVVTPSEIKKTSLLEGYNNINGMFQSREWKEYFFDNDAKVLLIEGSSKSLTSLAPRDEDRFWKELIEFTRNKDKLIIITYTTDKEESSGELFVPDITNDTKVNGDLIKGSFFIPLTESEEKDIEIKQRGTS